MLKKIAKLACLTCFALSGTLTADQQMQGSAAQGPEIYDGGVTLGLEMGVTTHGTVPLLTFGYINDFFLFDIGFNFSNHKDKNDTNKNHENYADFKSHLGLRNQVYNNLYVTYGVVGAVKAGNFNSDNDSNYQRPWSLGAFTGLDLQITKHFLLSGKIDPYKYQRNSDGGNENLVFASTSITLSYVF